MATTPNEPFFFADFAKCMGVLFGGAATTALAIGLTGTIGSRAPTGTAMPSAMRIQHRLMTTVPPSVGLVASCVFASGCASAAAMLYIPGVYRPSHGLGGTVKTNTSAWAEAEKKYRERMHIKGAYG
eukprot:5300369-Pyramimonas_sp.AAC.1